MWTRVKPLFDKIVAAALLVVLAPVMAVAAVAIRVTSGSPVLFRQVRIGRDGEPFTMLKFRTMVPNASDTAHRQWNQAELRGELQPVDGLFKDRHDPRVTRVGRLLRRYSIDELPQLVNVVRGEMALVGPRPSLPWEHDLFPVAARARCDVSPGITGLWQVSGRNRLDLREMLELDLTYAERQSMSNDLSILARTLSTVVRGDGAG
jgi:lipopolysaccharide/colanic/teichoic acid biosynthesis glycosyltransferase